MPTLDDLLAALGKVAETYNGEDDSDDEDDPDIDDEEGEDGEEENDDDFSKPIIMTAVMLLNKLKTEARLNRKQATVSRANANIDKIAQLQRKTAEMSFELESNRMLASEMKRNQEAALALYVSNLTPAEKKECDEDTQRMAVYYSSLCAEASPTWREEASMTFRNRKL